MFPPQGLCTGRASAAVPCPQHLHGSHLAPIRSRSGAHFSVSALPLLFFYSTPTLPMLCLFFYASLLISLLEGQLCEGRTFVCVFPVALQSPDKNLMQKALGNRNTYQLGAPHYISQALMPRVLGWWGRPCWVLGEACLNSSSLSACKLSLYLIPPTVISSLSLLPSPETCLHGPVEGGSLGPTRAVGTPDIVHSQTNVS